MELLGTEPLASSNHGRDKKCLGEGYSNRLIYRCAQNNTKVLVRTSIQFNINHGDQGILSKIINETVNIASANELDSIEYLRQSMFHFVDIAADVTWIHYYYYANFTFLT